MNWITRLKASFGAPFLFLITSIYWTQGFRSLPWMAISYQFKDELKLSPSASQFAITLAFMPWSIKPLYGILSDCMPIKGSRRISYLMISGVLSFTPWLLLGLCEPMRMSSQYMTGILVIQNLGTAMADVVVDAMIAEAARQERAEYAGDLQSMSWFAMALGGMFGSVAAGFALSAVDVKGIFLSFSILPLLQLVSCFWIDERALMNEVGEADHEKEHAGESIQERGPAYAEGEDEPHHNDEDKTTHDEMVQSLKGPLEEDGVEGPENVIGLQESRCGMLTDEDEEWVEVEASNIEEAPASDESRPTIKIRALQYRVQSEDSDLASEIELCQKRNLGEIDKQKKDTTVDINKMRDLSLSLRLIGTFQILFQTIRQPAIRQPMIWFFLAQVCVPSLSSSMFYYQTNHLHLDASLLGTSRLAGWGALILGTFIYNRYLKKVQLRRIFWWTHIALALITLFDTVLVSGLSTTLGISNKVFILGVSALGDAVNQFKFMPFLVLSGQLCEPGIEGTLFALFMSLNNLGTTLSSFFGAGLASMLHISSDQFENLSTGICIQALCTIFPIFFLHWIPEGTGIAEQKLD